MAQKRKLSVEFVPNKRVKLDVDCSSFDTTNEIKYYSQLVQNEHEYQITVTISRINVAHPMIVPEEPEHLPSTFLPKEVLDRMFAFFPLAQLHSLLYCLQVCRAWRVAVMDHPEVKAFFNQYARALQRLPNIREIRRGTTMSTRYTWTPSTERQLQRAKEADSHRLVFFVGEPSIKSNRLPLFAWYKRTYWFRLGYFTKTETNVERKMTYWKVTPYTRDANFKWAMELWQLWSSGTGRRPEHHLHYFAQLNE